MAWSNGRMHATKHRVMVKGEKDSYMDTLMDPLLFLPFNCRDYILYLRANFYLDSALDTFAGTVGGAVQGFKQRATGNMDDPFLIPGIYLIRSSCLTCSETCSTTLFEAAARESRLGGVPYKMAESMWLHAHLIQDLISISRTSVPKYPRLVL
ncbi:hypothetical protein C5167_006029 [Papaver somniferum]|uniref:Isopenicillin N synthase-like Fe(2+) 2OG dioxygenase domain-containing protein n=1 Tax=Papaver somniferum TaxID=3469 RepID=A0A4Y7JG02_PAPSO|nr:hypothetical protein C5167_006029 [Papaver somniferum]